ncbi:MAG: hypothetical protein JWP91_2003 [Fibrobacteres bacterium]|nr:hypothetical protein [Fibrobacterota bacterium]
MAPAESKAARDAKAPVWTAQDSSAAAAIVACLANRPEAIDSLTAGSLARDHGLGFGRRLREAWVNPAGKLGFAFKILYEGTRPISFEAKPVMNYGGLRARYLAALAPLFKPAGPGPYASVRPYYWNLAAAARPLSHDTLRLTPDSLPSPAIREALALYMSPYSGTLYGIRGGEAGQILENRDYFLGLTEILMAEKRLARFLLRSVNPATRLTAVEFIIRHKEDFPGFDSLQSTAFRAVYANPPKAATMRAGLETFEDPRKRVAECAREEARRDGRGVLRMY